VITCKACGKQNQGRYKFCLGCGAELSGELDFADQTARHMNPVSKQGGATTPPAVPRAGAVDVNTPVRPCPTCGSTNETNHRFCSNCGAKLDDEAPNRDGQRARLTSLNPDGSEGAVVSLTEGTTTLGRATGGVLAGDLYLSPRHATFTPHGDHVVVNDVHSLNGVFRKLLADQKHPLNAGDIFRIGQELIRFESLEPRGADKFGVEPMGAPVEGYVGRIAMVLGRKTSGTAFPVPETGLTLGRERGEVLFADDGYVSGLHCRISFEGGQVFLTDLGSSNGTFVRVRGTDRFASGEVLLMGQQLFRVTV
jgi:pSer/pThr/pTyr-binding forkhead associated (FHA) protein